MQPVVPETGCTQKGGGEVEGVSIAGRVPIVCPTSQQASIGLAKTAGRSFLQTIFPRVLMQHDFLCENGTVPDARWR